LVSRCCLSFGQSLLSVVWSVAAVCRLASRCCLSFGQLFLPAVLPAAPPTEPGVGEPDRQVEVFEL